MKVDIFSQKGFTLLELMVAMAIAGIVAAAMFTFQQAQTRGYVTQDALTNMQQNARGAMHFMVSEIRMAGCDPTRIAGAGIEEASDTSIRFTMDFTGGVNGNGGNGENGEENTDNDAILDDNVITGFGIPNRNTGDLGEDITYKLENGNLIRTDHNNDESDAMIARNIEALNFVYLDGNGNRIGGPGENLSDNQIRRIRAIQITTLARSDVPGFMYRHTDTQIYTNQEGDFLIGEGPPNDNVRRILLTSEARLRNM